MASSERNTTNNAENAFMVMVLTLLPNEDRNISLSAQHAFDDKRSDNHRLDRLMYTLHMPGT